ncbi:thrombospondin type 3 repeat-containing protein [Mariniflexile litorale]|uniref:Thrombospondin type 3 repeat-containing protein n=1 Tax=Mariniflexile litorale TaxID=3045158 RepID=A0AAU7EKD2_9FLAO|nr:thrombospondin type 3 repeat-containing protein [Mariniflexile sp. KMM 9835]MDQ8213268.1 thrombospondin type 3 repeat-containing protein [Mariniflexile sp. KMM 9835]
MIHTIRTSKFSKIIASYLAIQLLITTVQPSNLFALTSGPSQPEFNAFTPIGTSDMVNLSTGDFNYNIPIMDVGGYPLNLAYDSGLTMDQEASWVGLGWNLNVGQINRQVRGIPDDFKGDEITYEKNLKPNVTVGISAQASPQVFGFETEDYVKASLGLGIKYNNYNGISFTPSYGLSFDLGDYVTVGMNVQASATEGATISPKVSAKANLPIIESMSVNGGLNAGLSYNSNKGLTSYSLNATISPAFKNNLVNAILNETKTGMGTVTGNLSFSNPVTLTPRKRTAFQDFNSTFSFSVGGTAWGIDGELEISATASVQKIKDKTKTEKAFGYEFTGQATSNDVLDYNRENDRTISKNLLALPYANYTYDLYSVNGQGATGMFRSHRGQIGQIYDEYVEDESKGFSLGVEIEGGAGWHYGGNFVVAPSKSYTGVWRTKASNSFKNDNENAKNSASNFDYEPVYFKYVGENKVDDERSLYTDRLHSDKAMALKIGGVGFDKYADTRFRVKDYEFSSNVPTEDLKSFSGNFKRTKRDVRNQSIQKITVGELKNFYTEGYGQQRINTYAKDKPHHTAEIRVLKPDGATYVFGETAYNIEKQEVTFATDNTGDCATGIVTYKTGENSINNSAGIDHFYDNVKTPAYAHTYLLSSVLSSDYEDIKGDGPTDDDLGAYTLFEYVTPDNVPFQWRVPYGMNEASYNEGLRSNPSDQKGSYIYGQKEIKYIRKIETKTHVAIFDLSPRKDARGVAGKNGGAPASGQELYKINTIRLYSKPEYKLFQKELEDNIPSNDPSIQQLSPIKTAHFIYDYSLCKNINNNLGGDLDAYELSNDLGKLTLKQVYFTYRTSLMGKHTPYTFSYSKTNPDYSLKAFDIWGNYKPNNGSCSTDDPITTTSEFPFVDQQNKQTQDAYATAWSLSSIGLPSGGSIDLTYESDDYQYVQDKPTMQMFKVVGAGSNSTSGSPESDHLLYDGSYEAKYLYVKLPEENTVITPQEFKEKYLKGQDNKPIYFRFLMNMTRKGALNTASRDYDYVTGYFERDGDVNVFQQNESIYAAIPMQWTPMEGGLNGDVERNPITKAGLYFARTYLNDIAFGLNGDYRTENVVTIAKKLVSSIGAIGQIFLGPNEALRNKLCSQQFISEKSWIRLSTPKAYKLGGGSRIKQLVMNDHWNTMTTGGTLQTYGQTYDYTLEDNTTSGVAAFEPNDSAENPFVEPFYNNGERLIAPREVSYVEKPFGKAFFPYSKVTYSRVTVKNINRADITRHATGKVVSEFYTTKDFPTKVDYTDIENSYNSNQNNVLRQLIGGLLGLPVKVKNEFTLSQGYAIHTNDMDGKMRAQKVFQEGMDAPISSVSYHYSTERNALDNVLPVIAKDGSVSNKEIGVDYDVINDFREAYSKSETKGLNVNVAAFFLSIFPVVIPTSFPVYTKHENIAHSVITTKVIHTTAILKEKVARDLGSKVSTVNEAWDAETGEVILTKTINEFDDAYYNFNFPAYWAYNNMGQASRNLGLQGTLEYTGDYFALANANASEYLTLGDEIMTSDGKRLWVVEFNNTGTGVLLMNRLGGVVNREGGQSIQENIDFKIVRSGYRNQQTGNMASVTMMKNPLNALVNGKIDTASFTQSSEGLASNNLRIINASAVAYNDFWNCQCENNLPFIPNANLNEDTLAELSIEKYLFNPYLYNVKDEWRAEKSYAYLTERTDVKEGTVTSKKNTRKEGYFKHFKPYYAFNGNQWELNIDATPNWTFASEVTQYSPYGAELENKDALNRYSSAQYGYNFSLPTAVASNSKYRYMGGDNFEDYDFNNTNEGHFGYKNIVYQDGDRGIVVSNKYAHTGNSSLLITPDNSRASLPVELIGQSPVIEDSDGDGWLDTVDVCPYTPNPDQDDYDKDGIGDACDDNAIPKITNIVITGQFSWWRKQASFTIQGKPNDIIRGKIIEVKHGAHGWKASFNGGNQISKSMEFSIQLDATGRANNILEMGITAPSKKRKRSQRNYTTIEFILLNKYPSLYNNKYRDTPVSSSIGVRLEVVGYKDINSGKTSGATPIFQSQL